MHQSLYIHIPFCARKCLYCGFYSDIYDKALASSYIDVLTGQIRELTGGFSTIYIGGGTPTVFDKALLEKLLKALKGLSQNSIEFTVEANPESLDEGKIKLFLDSGVNRLSIGVQSLDDRKLKRLGRLHGSRKAVEAVHLAAKKGFKNLSADMIFGVWDEYPDKWKKELEDIVKLPVTHVSCYELTYEKNTPLFNALKNKSLAPLEDDITAQMYECAIEVLSLRGLKQYEVSNFAKEGCECRHNLNYWENGQYMGLGPSAFSYIDGVRAKNVADIKEYIRRAENGKSLTDFSERLPAVKRAKETAAVKIRTKDGIDFGWFKANTGFDFPELEKKALPVLLEQDLVKYKKEGGIDTGICLKRKGFLFCDTVSSTLL